MLNLRWLQDAQKPAAEWLQHFQSQHPKMALQKATVAALVPSCWKAKLEVLFVGMPSQSMVWQWLGHVLRMPDTALVKQVLTRLQSSEEGRTRYRTGPNNSGHRSALRYLHQHGISHAVASGRRQWQEEQAGWLLHHDVTGTSDAPAFRVPAGR